MHPSFQRRQGSSRTPAVNLPPVTFWLIIAMMAIHVIRLIIPMQYDNLLVGLLSFRAAAYGVDGWPVWSLALGPLTYTLLHGGFSHLILNSVMLAVMGQVLERRLGAKRFIMLVIAGALGGAVVHALAGGFSSLPLIGASASVGGLYAAGLVLHRRGMPLGQNSGAIVALAVLFVIFNVISLALPIMGSNVAYAAHLGGFVAGAIVAARLRI